MHYLFSLLFCFARAFTPAFINPFGVILMMEKIIRFRDNPANPKNILIPFYVLIGMSLLLEYIKLDALPEDGGFDAYAWMQKEILAKLNSVRQRQAYKEVIRAPKDEKQAALDNYLSTKQLNG